jgi:DNA-binding beta-propeller fold protein YncE
MASPASELRPRPVPNLRRAARTPLLALGLAAVALIGLLAVPTVAVPATLHPSTHPILGGPILGSCFTGSFASQPVYDPVTHNIYVLNQGSGNISVVAPPCSVVGTISLPSGASPIAGAFDEANDHIYVADASLDRVYNILGTTIVATIGHGHFSAPTAVAYDPGDALILVANFGWANLTSISGSTAGASIPVGIQPSGIAYDPFYNSLIVTNYGSGNATVIQSATYPFSTTHTNVSFLSSPEAVAYDPADQRDYIANYGFNDVIEVDGTGTVWATIAAGFNPISVTFDQKGLDVYVANSGSGNVTIISGSHAIGHDLIHHPDRLIGLTYDDDTDSVYVGDTTTGTLYELA